MRRLLLAIGVGVCAGLGASALAGDEFSLAWSTQDVGGGVLTGDGYEVMGTVGQPDAGILTDGEFRLEGGFWVGPPATGRVRCPADFNGDDFLDFFDYDDFVAGFEAGNPRCDFNADGFLDFFDYDDFVVAYEQGC